MSSDDTAFAVQVWLVWLHMVCVCESGCMCCGRFPVPIQIIKVWFRSWRNCSKWGLGSQKSNFIERLNKVRCWPVIWSYNGLHSFLIPCGTQLTLKLLSFLSLLLLITPPRLKTPVSSFYF